MPPAGVYDMIKNFAWQSEALLKNTITKFRYFVWFKISYIRPMQVSKLTHFLNTCKL